MKEVKTIEKKGKFDQRSYINDFKKKNYKRVGIQIPLKDVEVIKKLESVENKNRYLIDLIRQDINKK